MTIKLPLQRYEINGFDVVARPTNCDTAFPLMQVESMAFDDSVTKLEAAYAELERNLRELRERYSDLAVAHLKCTRRNDALGAERDGLRDRLINIGNMAHNASTGPAVPDVLWEIRGMAYEAVTDE